MDAQTPGRAIVVGSWASNGFFLAGSIPVLIGSTRSERLSAVVCLVLFGISLMVWVGAFLIAASRSSQGVDIAVGSLFLVEGATDRRARAALYGSFVLSIAITAVSASANPFAVLVPMLSLGLVGLWGARHGVYPPRVDVSVEVRPLRPNRSAPQSGGFERGAHGRARQ